MDRVTLQAQLDMKKWYDSEYNHRDMCGAYEFCAFCDKSVAYPCATAFEKMSARPARQPKRQQHKTNVESTTSLGKKFDYNKVMAKKAARKSLTFAEKYALSSDIVKERYATLQSALLDCPKDAKIKSRISKQCDTYRRGGQIVAKITIIGTSLRINLPLDPDDEQYCDGKTPHVNTGHKKVYEEVPFQFKVNSKLALKRALALIEKIK